MPYIKAERRTSGPREAQNAGELNYVITMTALDYIKAKGCVFARESYRKRIHATVLI